MERNARYSEPLYGTLPAAAKRYGLCLKTLRKRAAEGAFPIYSGDTAWPRVKFAEVEAWLRSTRIRPSAHAEAVVEERLRREGSASAKKGVSLE
jgi:hypothetical protein